MSRTHDDEWDLASSVGATATMVAAGRAMASKDPRGLINDPFAEPLVTSTTTSSRPPAAGCGRW